MKGKYIFVFMVAILIILPHCAGIPKSGAPKSEVGTVDQQIQDEQIYESYKKKNTIEGYEDFIAGYPGNQFVGHAQREIDRLKYNAYLVKDTIQGYREFIEKNPDNPYATEATRKIEEGEYKRCQKEDRLTGYQEFVVKYPQSYFVTDAKLRIREIEFKQLDEKLREKYGFDLLKYRLSLRRLKRDLTLSQKADFASFICDAREATYQGKTYFQTYLIYEKDSDQLLFFAEEGSEDVFDAVVFEALLYLQGNLRHRGEIDGFSFNLSYSSTGLYQPESAKCEYYFPVNSVSLFCQNLIDKKTLREQSFVVYPAANEVSD